MSKTGDSFIERQESGESHSPKRLTHFDIFDILEDNKPIAVKFFELLIGNELITPSNLKVIDATSYHSGGGCWHYFLQLSDKRVLTFHHTDDVEISYKDWDSIEDYIDSSGDQYDGDEYLGYVEDGFGWESQNPNYKDRQWIFPFNILMMQGGKS